MEDFAAGRQRSAGRLFLHEYLRATRVFRMDDGVLVADVWAGSSADAVAMAG